MKFKLNSALWRGRNGRLWRLADRIEATAQAVRYANKPHDLVFPITTLTDLTTQVREMLWEWLEKILNGKIRDRGRWPHL